MQQLYYGRVCVTCRGFTTTVYGEIQEPSLENLKRERETHITALLLLRTSPSRGARPIHQVFSFNFFIASLLFIIVRELTYGMHNSIQLKQFSFIQFYEVPVCPFYHPSNFYFLYFSVFLIENIFFLLESALTMFLI